MRLSGERRLLPEKFTSLIFEKGVYYNCKWAMEAYPND
jgi:hypothetical protein